MSQSEWSPQSPQSNKKKDDEDDEDCGNELLETLYKLALIQGVVESVARSQQGE